MDMSFFRVTSEGRKFGVMRIISGVAINTPTLVRIRKRLTSDVRGRSKDAPALWAAQRKYEEKHERAQVRADEEMDVGV